MASVHHFMLADLSQGLLAVCLYPLFILIPGYSLAWLLDLCEFRRRTLAFRAALSVCLSMSVCPIATYLAGRFGSIGVVWAMYGVAWLYFLMVAARGWRMERPIRISRTDAAVAAIVLVWVALVLFLLVDLQLGDRDYFPVPAVDFSLRSSLIHALSTTGIPPRNPFYFPGHPEPVRYHYFWLILCSMVERAGRGLLGPQHAWFGGVAWCGIGLMALVALSLRILFYQGPESFRRRVLTGILLVGVTGLDILPALATWLLQAFGMGSAVLASLDAWNDPVCGFLSTALWEAHYLAGLVICMTAFLLLWAGARSTAWSARVSHAVVAGLALASASGAAIYVAFVFGVSLAVWTLVTVVKRWRHDAAACVIAGIVAMAGAAPYLLDLFSGPAGGASGPPLQFQVRPFSVVDIPLQAFGITQGWKYSLANLLSLPLNYFLEFGFFLAAGRLWWRRRQRPLSRVSMAASIMVATSLLICTFVRSSVISYNDLGWRGMLVAQFVLLLWAVDVSTGASGFIEVPVRRLLGVLVVLGALGTIYDMAILRLYPWLSDHGVVSTRAWISGDRHLGRRNYAQREAYEWLDRNTAPETRIQFNPHVKLEDIGAFLYARRPMVAADELCLATFGGEPALCQPIQTVLDRLYPGPGQPAAAAEIGETCRSLPVDILAAYDTDPAWRDPQSWVWKDKPVFANAFVRLFACR